MKYDVVPEVPKILGGTYKLSDDAIRAIEDKVSARFDYLIKSNSFDDMVFKRYQEQLDKYMMKQYPDLSNRVNQMSLDLKDQINNFDKKLKDLVTRERKVVKSECIYEDVFIIRDELKKIKEFIDGLKTKMKKAFDV